MKVKATISIPNADSYGNTMNPYACMPIGSLDKAIEWIQTYRNQIKAGVKITVEFEEGPNT